MAVCIYYRPSPTILRTSKSHPFHPGVKPFQPWQIQPCCLISNFSDCYDELFTFVLSCDARYVHTQRELLILHSLQDALTAHCLCLYSSSHQFVRSLCWILEHRPTLWSSNMCSINSKCCDWHSVIRYCVMFCISIEQIEWAKSFPQSNYTAHRPHEWDL